MADKPPADHPVIGIELLEGDDIDPAQVKQLEEQLAPLLSKEGFALRPGAVPLDGLIALVRHDVSDAKLVELVSKVRKRVESFGRNFDAGGLPLFIVFVDASHLAHPGDTVGDWLQRIETAKAELHRRLRASPLLPSHSGFGSLKLHVWAIALQRPELKDAATDSEPFGVAELGRQMMNQARAHARRRVAQRGRLLRVSWGLVGLVAAMLLAGGLLLLERSLSGPQPVKRDEPLDAPDARLQDLLARGRKLLGFEGYRQEPATTRWPRWYRHAAEFRAEHQGAHSRSGPAAGSEAKLFAELESIDQRLRLLQDRAAVFGLAGDQGNLGDRPAVLHISARFTVDQAAQRRNELRKHYPHLLPRLLPEEIPLAVARELEATARANYEKLLEPARQVVVNRLKEASPTGQETPEAWRKLADGWLAQVAHVELGDWRELALLLAKLSGDETPADPLVELQGFLRQTQFDLPLGRIELHLPAEVTLAGGKKHRLTADGPLRIRYQSPEGKETPVESMQMEKDRVPGEPYVFRSERAYLRFEPGGKLSAQVRLADEAGKRWLLSWPAAESPSRTYTFAVLTQAPRLHPESVTDPIQGELVFAARLVPSQPARFRLPDLIPR